MFGKGITYSMTDDGVTNSINDSMNIENDDQSLFLKAMNMGMRGRESDKKLTFEGASEYYWSILMDPLQRRS